MKKTNQRKKVFVALSGGVDSSVSLYLLKKAGYDVTAAFIKIGELISRPDDAEIDVDKCWIGERREAARVAAYLNVPFMTFDFDKEYQREVLDYFFREYKAGRTPNPDVMCNKKIKFPMFWKKAKELGADLMATGHYTRISKVESGISNFQFSIFNEGVASQRLKLFAGKDKEKDQSYFLYNLKSVDLEHILFPIGNLKKTEVRRIAKEAGLPTAEKKDSQGLCFLGRINIREFLKTKIKPRPGKIINVKGKILGTHEGLAYYTIGQRRGIGIAGLGEPHFVVDKDFKNNLLIVAPQKDEKKYYKKWLAVGDLSWVSGVPKFPLNCSARIRYRAPLEKCIISLFRKGGLPAPRLVPRSSKSEVGSFSEVVRGIFVKFSKPQRAVTSGQSIVFYKGDEILGGGIIQS